MIKEYLCGKMRETNEGVDPPPLRAIVEVVKSGLDEDAFYNPSLGEFGPTWGSYCLVD